ncbi:MAG: hypothetical protein ACEQSK_18000 [Sphingomonadaceae bacterium]
MTTHHDHDLTDAEFDALLAGEGELARQLAALPQPESPAALDASILAAITARMTQETSKAEQPAAPTIGATPAVAAQPRPAAANNADHGLPAAPFRPSFMARWRMPMALAASFVGAMLLMLEWQHEDSTLLTLPAPPSAAAPAAQTDQPPPPAAENANQHASPDANPAATWQAAEMRSIERAATAKQAAAQQALAQQAAARRSAERDAAASELARMSPPTPARSAPAPAASISPSVVVPAPAPAPAITYRGLATPPADAAANWLQAIDRLLTADQPQAALREWNLFRVTYPDYPVPPELASRIAAAQ